MRKKTIRIQVKKRLKWNVLLMIYVVLTNNDPSDVVKLIKLSKKVYSKMIQNLVWALGYNIVAIPAAAGVFAVWGFFLRPEIGALVMSLSTVIVVVNAMTLRRVKL